ncbi:hypothetical protein FPZ54_05820 [Sphingomonas suaedae]|uniref:Uncharacterized protein n=2 Tax=Sphingomonas suaedae TaxID=2599297 RepID=A0A518RDV1_9SPHN|nr:hypothetical protein FPZ54_05820 [Sphingomonas suaedae]
MHVTILEGLTPIGTAFLNALDPAMGIAMGKFEPTSAYVPDRHANMVDGDYIADRSETLRVERTDGISIVCRAISIQDWSELGERELHLLEISEPSYEALVGEHSAFRAYWGKD